MLAQLLLGAILPLVARAQFNCASYWPSVTPGDSFTVNDNCHVYPGYPTTIGQTKVTVIYKDDWSDHIGIIDQLLSETFMRSIAVFSTLIPPPDIVLILGAGPSESGKSVMDSFMPADNDGPCQIRAFNLWSGGHAVALTPSAMQILAHEIYHCVQTMMLGTSGNDDSPSRWAIESSADYFSNIVFPDADYEHTRSINYMIDKPIYEQKYAANLWFQSLERTRGIVYLHQFAMATTTTYSADEERSRLASLPGFADDFFFFMLQYSFNRILDTNGAIVPIAKIPEYPFVYWTTNEDATEGTAVLETTPFTMSGFTLQLDAGQNVKIYSNAKGNQRLAWRSERETTWHMVPSGGSSGGAEGVFEIPCTNGPQNIRVLFTSTEAKSSDKVELRFIQQWEDENCCKRDRKRAAKKAKKSCTATSVTSTATSEVPEPTDTGSCAGSSIAMDPCLAGKAWKLDIPTTRELMKEHLSQLPGVTISGVQVSGAGGLTFAKEKINFTYKGLRTDVDMDAEGLQLGVSVVIDGEAGGVFYIKSGGKGKGTACLSFKSGKGTAKATIPFIGDQTFDLAPGGGYLYDTDVEYTCSGGRMTIGSKGIQSPASGGVSWGPFAYNA
ncbi:hypothetical protein B0T10DRAFT_583583 [Thelonectria olida]|uniref:Uncharacterized protein n=1 Tax=Thelonectria olida TaxID=1576542 RepID=A0A9P8WHC7_9HYPO|nr:hypothetical protein B0T10DRAFT_583583 [Thelonectria olida]